MKKRSHFLFWFVTPTYKYAERAKAKLLAEEDGKNRVTKELKKYNLIYLGTSILLALFVGYFFRQEDYEDEVWRFFNYAYLFLFGYLIFFSRAFEVFKAFLDDAVEKLNHIPSSSALGYGDRLRLAFNSYIELLFSFGSLYYILPSSFFKSGDDVFQFSNVWQAIYFSGVTMTTVGYGDISPAHLLTQGLVIFQVFCGLTLALVSFTVYTSLALANPDLSSKDASVGKD